MKLFKSADGRMWATLGSRTALQTASCVHWKPDMPQLSKRLGSPTREVFPQGGLSSFPLSGNWHRMLLVPSSAGRPLPSLPLARMWHPQGHCRKSRSSCDPGHRVTGCEVGPQPLPWTCCTPPWPGPFSWSNPEGAHAGAAMSPSSTPRPPWAQGPHPPSHAGQLTA